MLEKVVENAKVELPAPMVDEQVSQMVNDFASRLQQQGLSIEQYMQMTGMQPQALMDQMRPEAEMRIKTRLVLEAVAEKIKATDKDIDKELEKMAEMYRMEADKLKEMVGEAEKEQISKDVAVQKAVDLLVKEAVETEASDKAEEDAE